MPKYHVTIRGKSMWTLEVGIGLSAASALPTSALRERFGNCHSNLPEYLYAAYAAQQGNLSITCYSTATALPKV